MKEVIARRISLVFVSLMTLAAAWLTVTVQLSNLRGVGLDGGAFPWADLLPAAAVFLLVAGLTAAAVFCRPAYTVLAVLELLIWLFLVVSSWPSVMVYFPLLMIWGAPFFLYYAVRFVLAVRQRS